MACRPSAPQEIGRLFREMSIANSQLGAPRIHGELLKLGIDIGHSTRQESYCFRCLNGFVSGSRT